ncbi:hypothetical protein D5E69_23235 (plasmid) [Rossellomorea marisflavi]|uniref:hypothetical protein n=1 Tax=Rossellomorea marisflavi TaxID=189381 RepID=UPI001318C3FB|nr:hypothetical protein [Rossellomorea marisflavi]QHA38748.1 hypothetical protein D5E69_23235 [Rossellomorea marisflavi]
MIRVLIFLSENTQSRQKLEQKFISKFNEAMEDASYIVVENIEDFKREVQNGFTFVFIDSVHLLNTLGNVPTNVLLLGSEKIDELEYPNQTISIFPGITQLLNWLPAAKLSKKIRLDFKGAIVENDSFLKGQITVPGSENTGIEENKSTEIKDEQDPSAIAKSIDKGNEKASKDKGENIATIDDHQSSNYDYLKKARSLIKQTYKQPQHDGNKTIGVWSPLYRIGVTTFVINFGLFLGMHKIETAVLEGLNNRYHLKNYLMKMSGLPTEWKSYASLLHNDQATNLNFAIPFHNVYWLPIDSKDLNYGWNSDSLSAYVDGVKYYDTLLVDLPTGELEDYTIQTLDHLDEIWIVVDNNLQQVLAWKEYIQKVLCKRKINVYLIFNKKLNFSQIDRTAQEMEIPILATLPALYEEVDKNNFECNPLIDHEDVYEKLIEPFTLLGKHIMGQSFEGKGYIPPRNRWIRKFKSILPALKG